MPISLPALAPSPVIEPGWTLGPWIAAHLPDALGTTGPWGVAIWQWLALALLLVLVLVLGRVLGSLTHALLVWLSRRVWPQSEFPELLRAAGRAPLRLLWALLLFAVGAPFIGFGPVGQARIDQGVSIGVLLLLFDGLRRLVDVAARRLLSRPWARERLAGRPLVPLAQRLVKGAIIVIALLAVLHELGYSVTTLLAGLGIGGLAVALASQKTVENLFGAFSIAVDQPFRVGDFVRVANEVSGTVEYIGLRSTRLRTGERTRVTIPNGKLAEMRLETFAVRDRFLVNVPVRLIYGTTAEQVRAVVSGIEARLQAEPTFHQGGSSVRLGAFGPSSLDVEVIVYFATRDFDQLRDVRQELLLGILEVVEQAGTELAYPTQTLRFEDDALPIQPAPERTG